LPPQMTQSVLRDGTSQSIWSPRKKKPVPLHQTQSLLPLASHDAHWTGLGCCHTQNTKFWWKPVQVPILPNEMLPPLATIIHNQFDVEQDDQIQEVEDREKTSSHSDNVSFLSISEGFVAKGGLS
jgi:hypothetical protein